MILARYRHAWHAKGMFSRCVISILGMGCVRIVLGMLLQYLGHVLGLFWGCLEGVSGMCFECLGDQGRPGPTASRIGSP